MFISFTVISHLKYTPRTEVILHDWLLVELFAIFAIINCIERKSNWTAFGDKQVNQYKLKNSIK